MMLPDLNVLPAPLWLVSALHMLTLTLHFAAMNVLLGGVIWALCVRFDQRWENPTILKLVGLLPSALAATVTLGVAPLLFLQLVYPRQVYSAGIVTGWPWLLVIPAVILAYSLLYAGSFGKTRPGSVRWKLLVTAAALLGVSLVFSSVMSLAERPDAIRTLYAESQSGWHLNPDLATYLPRWLHMVLGALTVGAFAAGVLGRDNQEALRSSRRLFTVGMIAAALAGIAYLVTLGETLPALMRTEASWMIAAAVVLSLGSLHFFYRSRFFRAGAMLLLSLASMVYIRHELRILNLRGHFDPGSWRVSVQWSPLLVFGFSFLIAVAFIVYLLRLMRTGEDRTHTPEEAKR
jgi:hypothetical protein